MNTLIIEELLLRSQFKKENAIIKILEYLIQSQKYRRQWKLDGSKTNSNNVEIWFHNHHKLHVLPCQFSVNLKLTRYWLSNLQGGDFHSLDYQVYDINIVSTLMMFSWQMAFW